AVTTLLDAARDRIRPPDDAVAARVQRALDDKTKPRGSLGRLEELARRYAAMRATDAPPPAAKAIVVMAADHGVAAEGVSAYPQEVRRRMLRTFAQGGAAINVLARQAEAGGAVVDMGVAGEPEPLPGVRMHRIAPGTASFASGPAMAVEQARAALDVGV